MDQGEDRYGSDPLADDGAEPAVDYYDEDDEESEDAWSLTGR